MGRSAPINDYFSELHTRFQARKRRRGIQVRMNGINRGPKTSGAKQAQNLPEFNHRPHGRADHGQLVPEDTRQVGLRFRTARAPAGHEDTTACEALET